LAGFFEKLVQFSQMGNLFRLSPLQPQAAPLILPARWRWYSDPELLRGWVC
jgi:hypothetical protein